MGRPYSEDLQSSAVQLVASGRSCRETAVLLGISASSVIRWCERYRSSGSAAAGQMGGHRALLLLLQREWVLARLTEQGISASYGSVWRLLAAEGLTFKKKPARRRADAA